MRAFVLLLVLLATAQITPATAGSDPAPAPAPAPATYNAGVMRLTVATEPPLDVLAWYPTREELTPFDIGPFHVTATRGAPLADGPFPIVLLSHGGGRTGGSPMILSDLSARLAASGFVVIAPFHGKTGFPARPDQIRAAYRFVSEDARFAAHVQPDHLGVMGFSLGTAVSLVVAGATPDFERLSAYCAAQPQDALSCGGGPRRGAPSDAADKSSRGAQHDAAKRSSRTAASDQGETSPTSPAARLPLKALALLDPFAVMFPPSTLAQIDAPVLALRPRQSRLGDANLADLAEGLPAPPQIDRLPGGHFVFANVCPESLRGEAPDLCRDPADVDRASVHDEAVAVLARFFHEHL